MHEKDTDVIMPQLLFYCLPQNDYGLTRRLSTIFMVKSRGTFRTVNKTENSVLRFTDIIGRVPRDRTAQFSTEGAMKSPAKN